MCGSKDMRGFSDRVLIETLWNVNDDTWYTQFIGLVVFLIGE